jgi:hypothetical protein
MLLLNLPWNIDSRCGCLVWKSMDHACCLETKIPSFSILYHSQFSAQDETHQCDCLPSRSGMRPRRDRLFCVHVDSISNWADFLTKPLGAVAFWSVVKPVLFKATVWT